MNLYLKTLISLCLALPIYASAAKEAKSEAKVEHHVHLTKNPSEKQPITLLLFHGLGHSQQEVQVWAKNTFPRNDIKICVLDYKKAGLEGFQNKIQKVLEELTSMNDLDQKSEILAERELKLLPELRTLLKKNLSKIRSQFPGVPMENVVLVGYSLGGLIASTFVEVLSKEEGNQVQSLLVSMAPPVGFINLATQHKVSLPASTHVEIGSNDEIFVNGVVHTQKCCSVFQKLGSDTITTYIHEGMHKPTEEFHSAVNAALDAAIQKQSYCK